MTTGMGAGKTSCVSMFHVFKISFRTLKLKPAALSWRHVDTDSIFDTALKLSHFAKDSYTHCDMRQFMYNCFWTCRRNTVFTWLIHRHLNLNVCFVDHGMCNSFLCPPTSSSFALCGVGCCSFTIQSAFSLDISRSYILWICNWMYI